MTPDPAPLPLRTTLALGLVTFLLMLPETLPVPVLRGLVVERFQVGADLASIFMSANMVGALLAAPWIGKLARRTGARRRLALTAMLLDAVAMQALAHPLDYGSFLALRTLEGALHISALTLLMSLVADAAGSRRGSALGCLGAGLTLGVAAGAALGGQFGKDDPLQTLHVASAVLATAFALSTWLLPREAAPARNAADHGLLAAWRRAPAARTPLLIAFVDRFTVGFFTTGFPLLLPSSTPEEKARIGMLLGAFLFPFALLSWPFGRAAEKWSRVAMVVIGSAVYGAGVMAIGIVPVETMWLLMPVLGVSSAVMFVPSLLWLLERAPDFDRTTAMAAFHGAGSLGFLLGPVCCGQLIALGGTEGGVGYTLAFGVAGLAEIAAAALVLLGSRRR
ncbi:MAG: MFS transporter [Planctomycetes bacterium]|nr:MFS transporter [Planctomycetota bacterium]